MFDSQQLKYSMWGDRMNATEVARQLHYGSILHV